VHTWLKVLNDFKPDIVFSLDHFRWEMPFLPDNIIHIGWVMDVLPNIASQESASKIGSLDFVLNAFVSNIDFLLDFSYPSEAIIEAPVVANPYIYKSYTLNQKEKKLYSADICAFSNSGNPQKGLDYLLNLISASPNYDDLEKIFKLAYRDIYESFYHEDFFYSLEDYRRFLFEHIKAHDISIPEETLDILAENWKQEIGYRILRSIPLEWLHEKGYDLKIWGSEWVDHPVLSSYAQGVAANGETLSRIINACQIVIGTNPGISTHPRVFESILSNSFYLAYRIPEEDDWANIRKYLREDQEIVFAYSREDLYRKVDYYLENDAARKKITRNARKKILEKLTYEALISRVLQEIVLKLEEPRDGVQS
jgi:spore maturation protein CgeB